MALIAGKPMEDCNGESKDRPRLSVCQICLKVLTIGRPTRVLPSCQHTFCQSCLEECVPFGSLTLVCPVCDDQYIVPQEGLVAFEPEFEFTSPSSLHKQYTLMSRTAPDSGVDTTTTQHAISVHIATCTDCCTTEDVRWRCSTCAGLALCATCAALHKDKDTPVHVLIEITDILSDPSACTSPGAHTSSTGSTFWTCPHHPTLEVRLYCNNCETPLCDDCLDTSYKHSSHVVILLKDALRQHKDNLSELLGRLREHMEALKIQNQDLDTASQSLSTQAHVAAQSVAECFSQLILLMEQRKAQLLEELHNESEWKRKEIAKEQDFWNRRISEILSECELAESVINFDSSEAESETAQTVSSIREISDKLNEFLVSEKSSKLTATSAASKQDSEERASVLFFPAYLKTLEELIGKLGAITSPLRIYADAWAHGEGLRYCCIYRPATITLTTKTRKYGRPIHIDLSDIECGIASKLGSNACDVQIRDNNNGTYEMTYMLNQLGSFALSIKIYGQNIRGSPFPLRCVSKDQYRVDHCSIHSKSKSSGSSNRQYPADSTVKTVFPAAEDDLLLKVGGRGRSKGQFTNPQGLCSVPDGRIFVTDSNLQCVQAFSHAGDCVLKFGGRGRAPGNLQRPTGICGLSNDRLAITDYDNRWVNIFDNQGKFISRFGASKMLGPRGVAQDDAGRMVIVDNKTSSIFVYQDSKFVRKFGSRGNKPNQLAGPHYVAVGEGNLLYVTDFHHHCVKVFDINGDYIFSFGSNGEGNGQFNAPTGIAIDENHNVLVADWGNNRIQVFDSQGSFLSYVNSLADPMYGPQGLTITVDGCVAVSDSGNHCYKVYRYLT